MSIDQKTQPRICFKTCTRAFDMLIRALETLSQETLGWAFEDLRENWKLGQEFKSSATCLCYNMVHAVPITVVNSTGHELDASFL